MRWPTLTTNIHVFKKISLKDQRNSCKNKEKFFLIEINNFNLQEKR